MDFLFRNAAGPLDKENPTENLQAAMECIQALAKARMDEKVRSFLIEKLLEGFEGAQKKGTTQESHDIDQTAQVSYEKGEEGNTKENAFGKPQNLSFMNTKDSLLMFLNKALSHGALVLNDEDKLIRCLHDTNTVCIKEKGKENLNAICVHEEACSGEDFLKESTGKLKEIISRKERERVFQIGNKEPTVNTLGLVTETSTVKKDKEMSHLPGCLGVDGTFCLCSHVSPCQNVPPFAGRKDKEEVHSPQISSDFSNKLFQNKLASVSVFANKGEKRNMTPMTGPQSSISFLEAAKRSMISSSSPDSQHENTSSSLLMGMEESDMANDGGSRVVVPTETIRRRMELCKLSIIGRVILTKGEEPWNSKKLREKLNEAWNFKTSWRLISLGKGFFHVLLTSQEEFEKVWMRGAVSLKPGIMRFQKWSFGFDPTKEKSPNAQVWFRFYNLPWCLWDSSILTALSKKIGTPIRFDHNTVNGDFGHYARVLIDVDLSKKIKDVLQLDCGKEIFEVKVVPENIPNFCNACTNIGHNSSECRMIRRKVEDAKAVTNCNDAKAELAIQNRLEIHRNKGKEISHRSSSFHGLEEGGTSGSQENVIVSGKSQCTAHQGLQDSAKENHNGKDIEETAPDIGNQSLSASLLQGSKDILSSNKFAALEEYEDSETGYDENGNKNSGFDQANGENKVQKTTLSKGDVNHTLQGIRKWAEKEKRNIIHRVENSGQFGGKGVDENPTPKTPKRWSDIQEEEEENEAQEATPKPFSPKPTDILSFERNGELTEIFMKNGKVRFTPISDKSTN